MKLRRLNFKIEKVLIILIFLSGFFIMYGISLADNNKDVVINEIMYNSEDKNDWFEIFNKGENEINLKNIRLIDEFEIKDNSVCHWISKKDYFIKRGGWVVIGKGDSADVVVKSLDLNGINKDAIRLSSDNCITFFSEAIYDPKEFKMKNDFSLELDLGGFFRESVNKGGSPSEENPKVNKNGEKKNYLKTIRINEVLSNPKGGSDFGGEYIELYNFGESSIDLKDDNGWIIGDRVGDKKNNKYKKLYFSDYLGEKILKSGNFLAIKRESDFNFSLTEDDELYLLSPDGAEVDRIEYQGAKEGISYGYCEKTNKWRWSEFLTPGAKNEFKEVGEVEIKIDEDIYKDIYATFSVSIAGTKDKDLKVKWEFGDGKNSYKNNTKHKYLKNGKYLLKLTVFNGSEDIKKEFDIEVKDFPERKVSILSFSPNPRGKDNENEWIELKNKSKKKVNLKNWSIATGSKKKKLTNHPINDDFIIKAGKTKKITQDFSSFSLNNKSGYIELRYPNGDVAYDIKYKKEDGVSEDEVYAKKESGGWEWTKSLDLNNIKTENLEEDVLEIKQDDNEEVKEGGDNFVIKEISPEDIGKYSQKERINIINSFIYNDLNNIRSEKNLVSVAEKYVLGTWDSKNKKIREDSNFYYFNPQAKEEKHYFLKFWENLLTRI